MGEHRGGMGSSGSSGVGVQAGDAHEGPEELWGTKRRRSTYPVLGTSMHPRLPQGPATQCQHAGFMVCLSFSCDC